MTAFTVHRDPQHDQYLCHTLQTRMDENAIGYGCCQDPRYETLSNTSAPHARLSCSCCLVR